MARWCQAMDTGCHSGLPYWDWAADGDLPGGSGSSPASLRLQIPDALIAMAMLSLGGHRPALLHRK